MEAVLGWLMAVLPGIFYVVLVVAYFARFKSREKVAKHLVQAASRANGNKQDLQGWDDDAQWNNLELRPISYCWPLLLTLATVLAFGLLGVIKAGLNVGLEPDLGRRLSGVPATVLIGALGGYIWGLFESLRRYRVQNLTASSVYFSWFRMLSGAAVGGLAGQVFTDSYSPLVAFGIGTFPADTLQKWLRRLTEKQLKIDAEDAAPLRPPWSVVQGVTRETIDRLAEADVQSPVQLACAEPTRLFLRTNIEWRTILDMMDQAILAGYVEDKIEKLRPLGVRGAIELAVQGARKDGEADAATKALATALGIDVASCRNLTRNLIEDAQVRLIWALWFDQGPR